MSKKPAESVQTGLEDASDFEASFIEPLTSDERARTEPPVAGASDDDGLDAALAADAMDHEGSSRTVVRSHHPDGAPDADAGADGAESAGSSATDVRGDGPAWVNKKMGQFKLLRVLGEGSMGRVILARDTHLDRNVALKILRRRIRGFDENQRVRQFLTEAQAAARIQHPNVVQIYEINEFRGWWYIAMELVEGETLKEIIKAAGRLTAGQICPVIADAASALAVAHTSGIIHRDIKPGNLMITRNGRCKITDFGLVRIDDPYDPFHTSKQAVGTPVFMAPEVIHGRPNTAAVDVYSLGVTLYYALTGRPPFNSKNLKELIAHHAESDVPDVREHAPDCSNTLARLIGRAMAKQPIDRPTAAELAASLRAEVIATRGEESIASMSMIMSDSAILGINAARRRAGAKADNRSTFFRTAVAILAVLGIAAGAYWVGQYSALPPHPGPTRSPEVDQFAEQFPLAPSTYGDYLRPERFAPPGVDPPAFSWRGRIDAGSSQFAASKSGRYFFPIDSDDAALIRYDQFVSYATAEDAIADGKVAPQ